MQYASKEHIVAALEKGVRLDGRRMDEFRPVTIELDVVATAEGSAKVRCGDTEVIAGVKMATGKPFPDTPEEGVLMVNAELLPISNPDFEVGPPTSEGIELARVIDRGIRESKTIDVKELCIRKGELVWMVNVDICPINTDGNLIDIGALSAIAALKSARMPKIEADKIDYKQKTDQSVPVMGIPLPVTIVKIGEVLLVDPTLDEMRVVDARLTVTTEEDGTICAMQKGGDAPLTLDEIARMLDMATEKAAELRKVLMTALGK